MIKQLSSRVSFSFLAGISLVLTFPIWLKYLFECLSQHPILCVFSCIASIGAIVMIACLSERLFEEKRIKQEGQLR